MRLRIRFVKWLREFIIDTALVRLQVGGHCGCCGKYIPYEIVDALHPWSLCDDCIQNGNDSKQEKIYEDDP